MQQNRNFYKGVIDNLYYIDIMKVYFIKIII